MDDGSSHERQTEDSRLRVPVERWASPASALPRPSGLWRRRSVVLPPSSVPSA